MSPSEKEANLRNYVLKLNEVLKDSGFKIRWRTGGEVKYLDYRTDPEEIYFPAEDFTTITQDQEAFDYLKRKGLINAGLCPQCGKEPINDQYTFTSGFNPNIQYSICKDCYSQGTRMSVNPASDRPGSGGCLGSVALIIMLIVALAVVAT